MRKLTWGHVRVVRVPVDDAGAVPAGPTVLNVLSRSVGMSSVEKPRDDISGLQDGLCVRACLCVCTCVCLRDTLGIFNLFPLFNQTSDTCIVANKPNTVSGSTPPPHTHVHFLMKDSLSWPRLLHKP